MLHCRKGNLIFWMLTKCKFGLIFFGEISNFLWFSSPTIWDPTRWNVDKKKSDTPTENGPRSVDEHRVSQKKIVQIDVLCNTNIEKLNVTRLDSFFDVSFGTNFDNQEVTRFLFCSR